MKMVEKKIIKKVKKTVETQERPLEKSPDKIKEERLRQEEYEAMKKKYFDLKKRYEELEKAFNRISTLEQDVKKVHEKLDSFDANSANVQKDLAVVKSRVQGIQKDMSAISVVAKNISKTYGFEIKVTNPPQKPTTPAKPTQQRPPQQTPAQRPPPTMTRAAKALSFAREAEKNQVKTNSDEISAQPKAGTKVNPKEHKDATDRMDEVVVEGDDDTDTVDYLVKPEGRKLPLSKNKVEEEMKQSKDDE
jgi:hypothetical protein